MIDYGEPAHDKCHRTVSVSEIRCELATPCPLHDATRQTYWRSAGTSLRYTVERVIATLIALWLARHWFV